MFEEVMFLFFILFISIAIFTFLVAFTGVMFEIWVHVFEWIRERISEDNLATKFTVWVAIAYLIVLFTTGAFT